MRITAMTQRQPGVERTLDPSTGAFRDALEAFKTARGVPTLPGDLAQWPVEHRVAALRALRGMIEALPEPHRVFEAGSLMVQNLLPEILPGGVTWTMGPLHLTVTRGPADPVRDEAVEPANPDKPSVHIEMMVEPTDEPINPNPDIAKTQALQRLQEATLAPRTVVPAWHATASDEDLARTAEAFQHAVTPPRHPIMALLVTGAAMFVEQAMNDIGAETTELTLNLRDSPDAIRLDVARTLPTPSPRTPRP